MNKQKETELFIKLQDLDTKYDTMLEYLKNIQSNTTAMFADKDALNTEVLDKFTQILEGLGGFKEVIKTLTDEVRNVPESNKAIAKAVVNGMEDIEKEVKNVLDNPEPRQNWTSRGILGMIFNRKKKHERKSINNVTERNSSQPLACRPFLSTNRGGNPINSNSLS